MLLFYHLLSALSIGKNQRDIYDQSLLSIRLPLVGIGWELPTLRNGGVTVTGCIAHGEDAIPHRLALLYSV
jgi:hypothetical protein